MPLRIGLPELVIVLVIVVLVFGVGRLGDLGGALGKSIKNFRQEVTTQEDEEKKNEEDPKDKQAD